MNDRLEGNHRKPIGTRALGWTIAALMILLGAVALLLSPAVPDADQSGSWLHRIESLAMHIADARSMASYSSYPLPTVISYSAALVLGIAVAILAVTFTNTESIRRRVRQGFPRVRPILVWVFLLAVIAAPFLFELNVGDIQFSHGFFRWVATSRIGLLLWTEMVFLFAYASFLWCLIQACIWIGVGEKK